ncbi:DUF4192 domain-containing protein [Spongiactinospora sp. TRM90649]|uniref:DUF4192 domain-containing protein n=1 Tax=Spongiactinospora sp. TRM90649 TaxID=3031114 RepID=UPI0023F7928B|nr:DUF4192 domain-containing protein [Spongiactinospora sp. TRM90649]MDF5759018.1 DUF4192 domain-containing protein [Spongiactinospora sp. TRM90649]
MTAVSEPVTESMPTIVITSPADAIAVVPYMIGFHPSLSLVVFMISDDGRTAAGILRFDLSQEAEETAEQTTQAARLLVRNGIRQALLVGYGPGTRVTPVMDAAMQAMCSAGIGVGDALRVEDGRYWSYLCPDMTCCPPDGVAVDVSGSVPAATAVLAGMRALPDRAALAATLDPSSGFDQAHGYSTMQQMCAHARQLIEEGHDWYGEGVARVTEALDRIRDGQDLDVETVAWLGVALTSIAVRDFALTRIERYSADVQVQLWMEVTRKVPPAFGAAPASLLAFAALYRGDGALAGVAIERALSADPDYRWALLLRQAIQVGLPPAMMFGIDWGEQEDAIAAQAREYPSFAHPVLPAGW